MPTAAEVYKKIVDAKVFIDEHFDSPIDLDAMAAKAFTRIKRWTTGFGG